VKFWAGWTAVALVAAGATTWIVLAVQAHERELDRRCAKAGGVRVKITDEKLCFTEDWRWVKI